MNDDIIQTLEQCRRIRMKVVQIEEATSWQMHNASTDEATQGTLSTVNRTLNPRSVEEQQDTDHHVQASKPSPWIMCKVGIDTR